MNAAFSLLIESALIGFAIAAPVGPIGILCIRRTLAHGIWHGVASGLGAATADALYGSIIALGLTAVAGFILNLSEALGIIGGLFLLYLGVTTFRSPISGSADGAGYLPRKSLTFNYLSTLALTVTNPMTIMMFMGVFAGFSESITTGASGAGLIVLGVFLGSAAWWLILSAAVGLLRTRITPGTLVWINRVSGVVICIFALRALLGVIGG